MKRGQRVHRAECPGCSREVAYSRGAGELADFAYLRRHRRVPGPAGEWCTTSQVRFASLKRVS